MDDEQVLELLGGHGADLFSMRVAADRVSDHARDVENLSDDVHAAHGSAQEAVAGLLEGSMRNAPQRVTSGAPAMIQLSLFAGGAVRLFANRVSTYNDEVAALREQVTRSERSLDAAERERVLARREELEFELNNGANEVVWLLAGGTTDQALVRLWNQAALPMGAVPESLNESPAASFRGLLGHSGEYMGLTPAELGDHYAGNAELVSEIEDQLEPLLNPGNDAVGTIRSVVERQGA